MTAELGAGSLKFWVTTHPGTVLGDDTKGQIGGKATNRQVGELVVMITASASSTAVLC
jgi:hypothetical protein